ncbi:MAG: DUF3783 domain-containing protein [Oscillospiraceae bacterium]|nr:DUF3783 domain-containing protein [Oscillospiraceae bacterium]
MAMVLLYNFTEVERRMKLKLCLHRLGLGCRDVAPEEQGQPLGRLLGLPGFEPGEAAAPFAEEMLVMHALSREQFSALLDALRRAGISVALKAVVTETNVAWTSERLHRELAAEHAAMRAKARSIHRK